MQLSSDKTLKWVFYGCLLQAIVDALSFELPKVVAKLAGTSQRCSDVVDSIINHFIIKCSPRDMISVFSEV